LPRLRAFWIALGSVGLQVSKHLFGNMDRLQFQAAGVFDVARLGEHLEDRGPEPPAGRFVPLWHVWITLPATFEVIGPQLDRQRWTEETVSLTDDDMQEVAEQWAVLYGSGKQCMGGGTAPALTDQLPEVRPHCLQPTSEEPRQTGGRGRATGLKDIPVHDGVLPSLGIDLAQQQIGYEPALRQFQCPSSDVGLVSRFRHCDPSVSVPKHPEDFAALACY